MTHAVNKDLVVWYGLLEVDDVGEGDQAERSRAKGVPADDGRSTAQLRGSDERGGAAHLEARGRTVRERAELLGPAGRPGGAPARRAAVGYLDRRRPLF